MNNAMRRVFLKLSKEELVDYIEHQETDIRLQDDYIIELEKELEENGNQTLENTKTY